MLTGSDAARMLSNVICSMRAALSAGQRIQAVYRGEFDVDYKPDDSPLTVADRQSHETISRMLLSDKACNLGILSEEGMTIPYEERKGWRRFWLVDPLDGTKEFVKRNGEFTVNIALMEEGRPIAGVIYAPVPDVLYFGAKGLGAYRMPAVELSGILGTHGTGEEAFGKVLSAARRLKCSGPKANETGISVMKVIGSRSHGSRAFEDFLERLAPRYGRVECVAAGSSLKFCLLAEGKADLYPRLGPTMEWDTAAGEIIVEEAGGRVIAAETGGELAYNKRDLLNPPFIAMRDPGLMAGVQGRYAKDERR